MQRLDLEDFERRADAFDAAVRLTPEIDSFCSSTQWILPANQALTPPRQPWLRHSPNGYVALALTEYDDLGRCLQPLEAAWCFANGLIGPRPLTLVLDFYRDSLDAEADWDLMLLSGIHRGSVLFNAMLLVFGKRYKLFQGMQTRRFRASLDGGVDAFLGRRTPNFRRGLKRDLRHASALGVQMQTLSGASEADCPELYRRILAVEARSWKGKSGGGITQGSMMNFYRLMLPRLTRRGALRLMFMQIDGLDIGYILGGVSDRLYRGLQFSFDNSYRAQGLGNVLQFRQIEALVAEGVATYDLGSDSAYKSRWAEQTFDTAVLVVRK